MRAPKLLRLGARLAPKRRNLIFTPVSVFPFLSDGKLSSVNMSVTVETGFTFKYETHLRFNFHIISNQSTIGLNSVSFFHF